MNPKQTQQKEPNVLLERTIRALKDARSQLERYKNQSKEAIDLSKIEIKVKL